MHIIHSRGDATEKDAIVVKTDMSADHEKQIAVIAAVFPDARYRQVVPYCQDMSALEACAISFALANAKDLGLYRVVVRTDSENVMRALTNPTGDESVNLKKEIRDIRKKAGKLALVGIAHSERLVVEEAHDYASEMLASLRRATSDLRNCMGDTNEI